MRTHEDGGGTGSFLAVGCQPVFVNSAPHFMHSVASAVTSAAQLGQYNIARSNAAYQPMPKAVGCSGMICLSFASVICTPS